MASTSAFMRMAATLFCAVTFACICNTSAAATVLGIFLADAHDGHGQVPFQTDGTSAGTVKVNVPYRASSSFEFYATFKSITIFSYYPSGNAYILDFLSRNGDVKTWSDCNGCIIQNFHQVDSDLYFVATPQGGGDIVYKTSGTIATTTKICDVSPACGISSPAILSSVFVFQDTPYYSFVEFSGKTTVYKIVNGKFSRAFLATNASSAYDDLRWDSQVGNQIIFGNSTSSQGSELWATDGTQAGRHIVKSFYGGQASGLHSNPSTPPTVLSGNGSALVIAEDPTHGTGLWKTDATSAGTTRLSLSQADTYRIYQNYGKFGQIVGSKLYFVASDIDQSRFKGLGQSLYFIDLAGMAAPSLEKITYQNYEIFIPPGRTFAITPNGWLYTPGIQVFTPSCSIQDGDNGAVFVGSGCDEKLYRVNLTSNLVQIVANPYVNDANCSNDCDQILNLTAAGNYVLFSASDKRYYRASDHARFDNTQPWFSKGSVATSLKLKDLASYLDGGSQPYRFQAMP